MEKRKACKYKEEGGQRPEVQSTKNVIVVRCIDNVCPWLDMASLEVLLDVLLFLGSLFWGEELWFRFVFAVVLGVH